MQPEDYFQVTITAECVKVEHPQRKTEQVKWRDVEVVKIMTTDQGPFQPDVWLALLGRDSGCLIPQGTYGYDDAYERVSKLPGFDFEAVIRAMGSTENAEFLLWTKPA